MPVLLYNTERPEFTSLEFNEVVLTAARSGELPRFVFILPTPRMVNEVRRTLIREQYAQTSRPLEHLPLYTFESFAREFYNRIGPQKREVMPEVALALMQTAIQGLDLEYYSRKGANVSLGVVQKIARVINGVRADGIMPSDFADDIEYAEAHKDERGYDPVKLRDLHAIYSRYLRLLNTEWVDQAGMMVQLNTALVQERDATFRRAFPGTHTLLAFGFTEFSQPAIAMLQQLGYVRGLSSMIYFDYARENGPLYGNYDDVHRKLVTSGYRSLDLDPLQTDVPEEERRPFRHHMRKNLFRTDDRIENSSFDHLIRAYGFFNREEEVQGIAAMAKSLILDQGIQPERICITAFAMDGYADLFREHLATHGIPSTITAPLPLNRNSVLTALLAALAIPAGGYDRRDVIRAITSPYLSFGAGIDAAALTEASTQLRIRRGRNAWVRRIEMRIAYLRPRLAAIDDDDDRRAVSLELETLERALESIRTLTGMLDAFDRRMSPVEFRDAFLTLTATLRAPENVLRMRHELDARTRTPQDWLRVHDEMERDTRALASFLHLLEEMTAFFEAELDRAAEEADGGATKAASGDVHRHPLEFYIEHLRAAAINSHYRLREKHDYGVLVAPVAAMQSLEFDVVILCGLIDGEFPSTYIPEMFLGRPLPDAQDRQLRRERVLFYSAITSFTKSLVATWPRFSGNAELVRSSFLDALIRITTIEESGFVTEVDELRVIRDRVRRGEMLADGLGFLEPIATLEALAEETGAALWARRTVPRIPAADGMLTNLRHTAAVERERAEGTAMRSHARAGEFRGVITEALSDIEREELAARRSREYSPSQLELYARCPFKFFARRVVGAHAPASYDVSLTPLERGLLLHKVLFRLYSELRDDRELPLTAASSVAALERARELAREEIAGIIFDHPYWRIDQERILGSGMLDGLLERWIHADAERTDEERTKLTPEFFEVGFGMGGGRDSSDPELSRNAPIDLHGITLRGKVDRVETYRRGDEIFFTVADYKTGAAPSRTEIRDGTSLQLIIYLEVIRHLLADHYHVPLENVKPAGGIYYRLDARRVDAEVKAIFVPNEVKKDLLAMKSYRQDPETVDDLVTLIGDLFGRAAEYVEAIASGRFPVTPHDVASACRGCEYHAACRVSQLHVPAA
ncbi:MAG TPA: PD-(D/E)XK nuclease family protein [Candidatus Kapabacteria bacterium]|nr:PD-(D/E)XK nuclease family protein [Candidatus Kapabacteria bacterium]